MESAPTGHLSAAHGTKIDHRIDLGELSEKISSSRIRLKALGLLGLLRLIMTRTRTRPRPRPRPRPRTRTRTRPHSIRCTNLCSQSHVLPALYSQACRTSAPCRLRQIEHCSPMVSPMAWST